MTGTGSAETLQALQTLTNLAVTLTGVSAAEAQALMRSVDPNRRASADAFSRLVLLVRQVPLPDPARNQFLARLDRDQAVLAQSAELVAILDLLRHRPLLIPIAPGPAVTLPLLTDALTEAYQTLFHLHEAVPEPWTLIGGLMVMTHCAQNGAGFSRSTEDADVAVSVFTHRQALATLTTKLRHLGYHDESPNLTLGAPRLSYRWVRGGTQLDVTVPDKANEQQEPATTAAGRPGVEMPATQQALRRTQRLHVQLANGAAGYVRRPDLMGSIVIKAAAAVQDSRDPARHRDDLVVLCQICAMTGAHVEFLGQLRPKDTRRIRLARAGITSRQWRQAEDPEAARGVLDMLSGTA